MSSDKDLLQTAREQYALGDDGTSDEKAQYEDDYRFARLSEQWPIEIQQQRKEESRPCHTINRQPAFIRQVVNDGRQNRPSIKVRPVNSGADQATAEIMGGLIRHIEQISDADVAYDTALDCACSGGYGFIGVDVDYTCDDSFDMELKIVAKPNPLAITWDPRTQATDSSDWDFAFEDEEVPKEEFEEKYPKADSAGEGIEGEQADSWFNDDTVIVRKWYEREKTMRTILLMSDGSVIDEAKFKADDELQYLFQAMMITPIKEREVESYKINIRKITGCDILETKTWAGSVIPLVPVWGDMLNMKGKRYSRSLIHDAKDSQRTFNYSRSAATELISLAPKVPFIGEDGVFDTDADKWSNVNVKTYPYITFKRGMQPPARQPFAGVPEGAMSEAMASLDDMKQIVGIHDASLGVPGNEISGVAIKYRQHEGDVSTFHFIDNQHRAVRAVGRICLDMIPQVYTGKRIIRIIGQDGKPAQVQIGRTPPPMPGQPPAPPQPNPPPGPQLPPGLDKVYDLCAGKYDLAVEAGPSYTTRREEAADMITTFISAAPQTAPILGPMLAKMSDWPEADKVSDLLATLMPPEAKAIFTGKPMPPPGPPPEVQEAQMKMQAEMAMDKQKAEHQAQLAQQAQQNKLQIEQAQAQADIAVMQQKAAAEMQLARERAALEMQLKREEAQLAAQLKMVSASQQQINAPTESQVAQ